MKGSPARFLFAVRRMSTTKSFCDKGKENADKAIEADEQRDYAKALSHYIHAVDYFMTYLKYEKNAKAVQVVTDCVEQYLSRAETLKKFIREHPDYKPGAGPQQPNAAAPAEASSASSGRSAASFSVEKCNVRWDDIAGLESAKKYVKQAVMTPLQLPHLFKPGGLLEPWKGVLLFGPPGTGKTYLAKAAATEADCAFFAVVGSDIFAKYVGESEKQIKEVFQLARSCDTACIIFFDEIDALGRARSDADSEVNRRVLTEMLNQMDGIQQQGSGSARVVVIAATNRPWELDGGIIRRLEKRIHIGLPDAATRKAMISKLLVKASESGNEVSVGDREVDSIVAMTEWYSAADMATLIKEAKMNLLRKIEDATHFRITQDGRYVPCSPDDPRGSEQRMEAIADKSLIKPPPLTFSDIARAAMNTKSSVVKDDLDRYDEFVANFGVMG